MNPVNLFNGHNSVYNSVNPHNYIPTKCVRLPESLNPFTKNGVDIFGIEAPSDSIKIFPAYYMLERQKAEGKLEGVHTLVESTSGNFGRCLLRIAKNSFDIPRVVLIVKSDLAPKKKERLDFEGAEVISLAKGTLELAKEMGEKPGYLHLNQYGNPDNPAAHRYFLGPQIYRQLPNINLFAAAMGTTGTIIGVSQYLKLKNPKVFILGVNLKHEEEVPGVRDLRNIEKDITLQWQPHIDDRMEVEARSSYRHSLWLNRRASLQGGPSSGSAYLGLLKWIIHKWEIRQLDNFRNEEGKIVAAFLCPDDPSAYIEKYLTYLPAQELQY